MLVTRATWMAPAQAHWGGVPRGSREADREQPRHLGGARPFLAPRDRVRHGNLDSVPPTARGTVGRRSFAAVDSRALARVPRLAAGPCQGARHGAPSTRTQGSPGRAPVL